MTYREPSKPAEPKRPCWCWCRVPVLRRYLSEWGPWRCGPREAGEPNGPWRGDCLRCGRTTVVIDCDAPIGRRVLYEARA